MGGPVEEIGESVETRLYGFESESENCFPFGPEVPVNLGTYSQTISCESSTMEARCLQLI